MHEVALVEKHKDLTPFEQEALTLAAVLSNFEQVDMPVESRFAPSVYLREIFMPKGTFVIGKRHKTEHFNIVLSGEADVLIDGQFSRIKAPCIFVSKAGARKILNIIEDMRWATVHPTQETDLEKLEQETVHDDSATLEECMKDIHEFVEELKFGTLQFEEQL